MSKTTLKRPTQRDAEAEDSNVPASCGLPPDVHAKITAEADRNERTFAAQLRMIAKEWAGRQPAR